jgi:hypothetical protein
MESAAAKISLPILIALVISLQKAIPVRLSVKIPTAKDGTVAVVSAAEKM